MTEKTRRLLLAATATSALLLAPASWAQEGGGRGRGPGGPGGPGGMMRGNPIVAALDANGDGTLSADEINGAPAALRKLDKNGDGKLTQDEIRPAGARGPGAGQSPEALVTRMFEYDKNGDGKLTKEELPERMQRMIERGDTNKDGALSKEEVRAMAASQPAGGGGQGQGQRRRQQDDRRE